MLIPIDIPEELLQRVMLISGRKSAQEAVLVALEEFIERHPPTAVDSDPVRE